MLTVDAVQILGGRVLDLEVDGNVDFNGNYVFGLQNLVDLANKGPAYWLDGVNDHIVVADNANLTMGDSLHDNPFSVVARVRMIDATEFPVIGKGVYNATGEWRLLIAADDKVYFQAFDESVPNCYIGRAYSVALTDYEDDWISLIGTYDGSGVSSGFKIILNGDRVDDIDADNVPASYVAMQNGVADLHIGRDDALYASGGGSLYYLFNLALMPTEAKAIFSGAPIPYKYLGASQTLIVPSDDAGADLTANWTDVNGALSHAASEYTYTVTTGANVASFTDEAALTIGKRYRATVLAKDGTGAGATVRIRALTNAGVELVSGASITVAAAYAKASVEWTATETDNKVQIEIAADSVANLETVLFDTIECMQIGCVMQLEQAGITSTRWVDLSGNALDGVVSGAVATNLESPVIDVVTAYDNDVENNDIITLAFAFEPTEIVLDWNTKGTNDSTNENGNSSGTTIITITAVDTITSVMHWSGSQDVGANAVNCLGGVNDTTNVVIGSWGFDGAQATVVGIATWDTTGGASEHLLTITFTTANAQATNDYVGVTAVAHR
jgi:hypothetical protein